MALKADFPLPGTLGSVPAYMMIAGILHNRVEGAVQIQLAYFKDSATRKALKDAKAAQATALAQAAVQRAAQIVAQNADEANAAARQLSRLQADYDDASDAIRRNAPVIDSNSLQVTPDKIASVMNDDCTVSVAKVYAYLKTLPQYADATDE